MNRFEDTQMGGSGREFPTTRFLWTTIRQAPSPDAPEIRDALAALGRLYWKPIYAYIRSARNLDNEQAKDLTQAFLAELVDGDVLRRFAPERGSFRTYLKGAIHKFILKQHRDAAALKRGGGARVLSLDDESCRAVESLSVRADASPDDAFEDQWQRTVVANAVEALKVEFSRSGRKVYFDLFDAYDLHPPAGPAPTYPDLARRFNISESDVGNFLRHCRNRLKALVRQSVSDYSTDDDVDTEVTRIIK